MNAIEDNRFSLAWNNYAKTLPEISTILCVSAHWYTNGIGVTAMSRPRTIHDFSGFPQELFEVDYDAPGDANLAETIRDMLNPMEVVLDQSWGLDHGTWSILHQMFPKANIPVIQLSINAYLKPEQHYEIGKALAELREQGVFILGSGNVVHNIRATLSAPGGLDAEPLDWNVRFHDQVIELVGSEADTQLCNYSELGKDAALSIPTPDHYLPLLYVLGARDGDDSLDFPVTEFSGAGISMLSVAYG